MTGDDPRCPFCGCCLEAECRRRPCPEWAELAAEAQAAPVIDIRTEGSWNS